MANLTLVADFYLRELSNSEIQAIGGSDQCTPPFNLAALTGLGSFDGLAMFSCRTRHATAWDRYTLHVFPKKYKCPQSQAILSAGICCAHSGQTKGAPPKRGQSSRPVPPQVDCSNGKMANNCSCLICKLVVEAYGKVWMAGPWGDFIFTLPGACGSGQEIKPSSSMHAQNGF